MTYHVIYTDRETGKEELMIGSYESRLAAVRKRNAIIRYQKTPARLIETTGPWTEEEVRGLIEKTRTEFDGEAGATSVPAL